MSWLIVLFILNVSANLYSLCLIIELFRDSADLFFRIEERTIVLMKEILNVEDKR